jgi:hypothetical protein
MHIPTYTLNLVSFTCYYCLELQSFQEFSLRHTSTDILFCAVSSLVFPVKSFPYHPYNNFSLYKKNVISISGISILARLATYFFFIFCIHVYFYPQCQLFTVYVYLILTYTYNRFVSSVKYYYNKPELVTVK